MARKKKTMGRKVLSGLGKGTAWTAKQVAKGTWFVVKSAVKGTAKAASNARKQRQVRKQQPQAPASYVPFGVSTVTKGTVDDFEHRLLNESLILAVAGRRGSGKSVLGFRMLENIHAKTKRPCFALGVPQAVLPGWISEIEDVSGVKNKGVVLVDEGAIAFSSRESMSKNNRSLGDLLAIARHKDLSLLFITQNTGMIDKNVLNLCDTIVLKEGSLLQEKMERSVMKDLYKTANSHISKIPAKDRKSVCYVVDADFEGLLSAKLPSFWSSKVSKNQA